jgi:hypothetical protein
VTCPLITDEPAVLTWAIALANRDRFLPVQPPRRHWWRELVTTHHRDADDQWLIQRERECSGWSTEEAEYAAKHPRPTLKAFMVGLSSGRIEPGAAA